MVDMVLTVALTVFQLAMSSPTPPPPPPTNYQERARREQARFETIRRMHLPRDRGSPPPGPHDVVLGRFHYWYDSTDTARAPEPRPIVEARARLIAVLDSLGEREPSDGWIAGQRVRYLLEAERADDALDAATPPHCAADRWWCAALAGLALHESQRYESADSAFGVALTEMLPRQRCDWTDVRMLVWPRVAKELSGMSCADRERAANKLWAIAQPRWGRTDGEGATRGNELRTEQFARRTMARILSDGANTEGLTWGDDSRELLLRYGWPEWFTREQDFGSSLFAEPRVTGHDREPSFVMFPDVASAVAARLTPADWQMHAPFAPSRYAPRDVHAIIDLPHQLTRFPRGDSTLVVVQFSVRDRALASDDVSVMLGTLVADSLRLSAADPTVVADQLSGTVEQVIPNESTVVSVEVYGARTRRLARARYTIDRRSAGPLSLSDLLLFDASAVAIPVDLAHASGAALATMRHSVRRPLGLLWELHGGTARAEPVWLSVKIEPVHVGAARRLATKLHLAPEPPVVRLRWQAVPSDTVAQSVSLHLPENARGVYRITLAVETRAGPVATSAREVDLVPE